MPKPPSKKQVDFSDEDSLPEDEYEDESDMDDDEVGSEDFDEEGLSDQHDDQETNQDSNQCLDKNQVTPKVSKHILQLREKLGLDELVKKKNTVVTEEKSKQPEKLSKPEPLVVIYKDPSKRKKNKKPAESSRRRPEEAEEDYDDDEPMDLIKAKHEVKRFAIQAMNKTKGREEAQKQLAISLGAVAPKQKPVNYKVLKQIKEKDKARAKRLKEADNIFASKIQSMVRKNKTKKKDNNKVTNFDANFGKLSKNMKKGKKSRGRK